VGVDIERARCPRVMPLGTTVRMQTIIIHNGADILPLLPKNKLPQIPCPHPPTPPENPPSRPTTFTTRVNEIGDHPENNLAKFGYIPDMKVEKERDNPSMFLTTY